MRNFSEYFKVVERFHEYRKKKFIKYGLPFLIFMVVGSFGLEQFSTLRYEFRKSEVFNKDHLAKLGIKKKDVTLEEEYEKIKKLDIDSWENIRGPRPWEEPQQTQKK